MANAIRSRTVQKGIDPRGFALVAFGGAGPLHGAEVAQMLEIPEVLVPPYPGITSAMGLLTTDFKYDAVRTQFQVSGAVDLRKLNQTCRRWSACWRANSPTTTSAATRLEYRPQRRSALRRARVTSSRSRSRPGELDDAALTAVWEAFHQRHASEYGHAFTKSPIEVVNVRVTGIGHTPKLQALHAPEGGRWRARAFASGPACFGWTDSCAALTRRSISVLTCRRRERFPWARDCVAARQHDSRSARRRMREWTRCGNIIITIGETR